MNDAADSNVLAIVVTFDTSHPLTSMFTLVALLKRYSRLVADVVIQFSSPTPPKSFALGLPFVTFVPPPAFRSEDKA